MELQQYTAKTFVGLEGVLEEELRQLGATNTRRYSRAVAFEGDLALLYRANFQLRTALRILCPLATETVRDQEQLYAFAHRLNWLRWFMPDQTFAITAKVIQAPAFNNSTFVALKVKDALVDQFRRITGERPSVDKDNPDVRIDVFLYKDQCTISIDSSGESLHRRGYRSAGHRAPLNEVLAAGMLQLAGWKGEQPLVDPFCGTGTLLIEAALMARNIAPNIKRESFGFQHWKNYDAKLWDKVWLECRAQERRWAGQLIGGDISGKVVRFAQEQVQAAGVAPNITLHHSPFAELPFPEAPFMLLSNPPYGERLDRHEVETLYQEVGDRLKAEAAGAQAWLLSSVPNFHRFIGLRPSQRITLYNGGLDCQFLQFELYTGTRRAEEEEKRANAPQSSFSNKKETQRPYNKGGKKVWNARDAKPRKEQRPRTQWKEDRDSNSKKEERPRTQWKENRDSFSKNEEQPNRKTGGKRWKEKRSDQPWKGDRDKKSGGKKWNRRYK